MIRKNALYVMIAAILGISVDSQAFYQERGFHGQGVNTVSVEQALQMKDDAPVVLVGKIEKRLGHEKYQFSDNTGHIIVEIDDEDWNGLVVNPGDVVEIRGEVEKEKSKTEIDVDSIRLKNR